MPKTKLEKYIITYQSQEHHEVLGYVEADNIDNAIKYAKENLKTEAGFYEVEEAKIAKFINEKPIFFGIK